MKTTRYLLFLILFLTLPALACSLTQSEEPTPEPTVVVAATTAATATTAPPTQTPVPPTETPPPPTPTPDPLAAFEPYESAVQAVNLRVPEGWIIEDDPEVLALVSDPAIFDAETFSEGGVLIIVNNAQSGLLTLEAFLELFVGPEGELLTDVTQLSEPETLEINGQDALQAQYTGVLEGMPVKAKVTVIRGEESAAVVMAVTPPDGSPLEEELMDLIISSIVVQAPPAPVAQGTVSLGETVTGAVGAGGSSTWAFTANEGDRVNIIVDPATDSLDAVVDVLDAQGSSVLESGALDDSFGLEETGPLLLSAGEYSIVVSGFADSFGEYDLTLEGLAGAAAASIAIGDAFVADLAANSSQEYAFTGTAGQLLAFAVLPNDELDVVLTLLGPDGRELQTVDESFNDETLVFTPATTGSYTLVVESYDGSPGSFAISLQTAGGGGEQSLSPGDTVSGELAANTPQAYRFTGFGGESLTFVVTPDDDLDVVVSVLDVSGSEIDSVDASFDEETLVFSPPEDGEYTLLVESYDGSPGAYTLAFESSGAGSTTEYSTNAFDVSPIPDDGILLEESASIGSGEAAVYTLSVPAYRPVTVYVQPLEDFDAVVDIFDSEGTLLQSQDFLYDVEEVLFIPPYEDDFRVEVSGFDGVGGSYDIVIFRGALGGVGYTGSVVQAVDELVDFDDEHAFPFTTLSDDPVLITVDPEDFDLVVEVVNDDTDEVVRAVDATFGYERVLFQPPAEGGNFRFVVKGFEGETGSYAVTLVGGPNTAFELAPGDIVYGSLGDDAVLLFNYSGLSGETIIVTVDPTDALDAVVSIEPTEGDPYVSADEGFAGFRETASFEFDDDELVWFVVRGFDGDVGSFTMAVELE